MSGCNTICNKCGHVHNADTGLAYIQQLNAANKRIEELEATMNQVRSTYNQIIAEDTATRNEYLDEIAKLKERIRVADAEEPVCWWNGIKNSPTEESLFPSYSDGEDTWHDIPLYAGYNPCHAQIPAEVGDCVWEADEDGNWETDCHNLHILIDGNPVDNGMEFCCYCGKHIKLVKGR